jgi:hypothetical protein
MEEEKKEELAAVQEPNKNDETEKDSAVDEKEKSALAEEAKKEESEKTEEKSDAKKKTKPVNKKFISLLIILVIAAVAYSAYKNGKFDSILGVQRLMTVEEATAFVNENLVAQGATATVNSVTEESGLTKIELTIEDQAYTIYLSKDKNLFFPKAYNIAEIKQQKADAAAQEEAAYRESLAKIAKNDKPVVELFVMSHCPYGIQTEKGIIPAVKALGDKIDFSVKFCDYAMHDEKELKEEMNQYCIQTEQKDKYIPYLECFLGNGDSATCASQAGVNTDALNACVAKVDIQYGIMAGYKDQSTWVNGTYPKFPVYQADVDKYQISGSPTLLVNGTEISSKRTPATLLEVICSGFTTAPEQCSQSLSTTAPSADFGYGEGADTNASCG